MRVIDPKAKLNSLMSSLDFPFASASALSKLTVNPLIVAFCLGPEKLYFRNVLKMGGPQITKQ
jgi:hypothetical protein